MVDKSGRTDGTFERADFTYDDDNDLYVCPGGKELKQSRRAFSAPRTPKADKYGVLRYRARKAECDGCQLKSRCCPKDPSRKVTRSIHEPSRDVARKIYQTIGFLIPYAVSIALLPFFCDMANQNRKDEMGGSFLGFDHRGL